MEKEGGLRGNLGSPFEKDGKGGGLRRNLGSPFEKDGKEGVLGGTLVPLILYLFYQNTYKKNTIQNKRSILCPR